MDRKWILVSVATLLVFAFYWGSKEIAHQWLTQQAQVNAQQSLLNSIGEMRHALRRFYHLPYLINNNPDAVSLVVGRLEQSDDVEQSLSQLDKAANTEGWYLLSDKGRLVASSIAGDHISNADLQTIVADIHRLGEGTSLVLKTKGERPFYYLSAPIFEHLAIVGIVVVQLDLRLLTDQWLTSSDLILLRDPNGKFFLSSSDTYSADWLNDADNPVKITNKTLLQGESLTLWNMDNKHYFSQTIRLDDVKWLLTYLSPTTPVDRTSATIGLSASMVFLLLFLTGVIGYQRHQKLLSQQRIQALIKESEQKLNQMINKTQVGLILFDQQGGIVDINAMAIEQFAIEEGSFADISLHQLLEQDKDAQSPLFLESPVKAEKTIVEMSAVEKVAIRRDHSAFPVLFSLTSFPFHGTQYYLATVLDISKRKKAEHALYEANMQLAQRVEERTSELREAQARLIESSKMAALGRMSSAIVHELNQPLTGLRTLTTSNALLSERGEMAMVSANNELIETLIDRMVDMATQLKTFAYSKPERLQAVSFTEGLQEVLRIYQQQLLEIDVRVRLPSGLPKIEAEEQRLRQVLGNLISNAVDALEHTPQPRLTISVTPTESSLEVKISDNGCGIDNDALSTIFEPFTTNKRIGKGLGLGLSIVANNMRDMGGDVQANTNQKGGMTFVLRFTLISP
ncbi:ATP-binding protein [Enterovibrio sp. ZSDZ42]|uniref:histidine kinase n=1 Tax=Enterovibrio gelatinilyticus TaxID=2899819 RepID=A0ABT5R3Y5_9GAMM|nr:ATP-binding protein [Enterovibrio sp. ZSDZ42]MDD1794699.1 ATP-binding protein [Enterovibrio sp. ZSDZ42]